MTTTTATKTKLTAGEAFAAIERHEINLVGWKGLRLWVASAELQTGKSKRALRIVSAIASTPLAAVAELVSKLDNAPQETALFEEEQQPW